MTITWLLYITSLFENLDCCLSLFCALYLAGWGLLGIGFVITCDGHSESEHEYIKSCIKSLDRKFWIFLITLSLIIFIPGKSTMYLMLGTSYLSSTDIPSQAKEVLELKLSDIIKEFKEKK